MYSPSYFLYPKSTCIFIKGLGKGPLVGASNLLRRRLLTPRVARGFVVRFGDFFLSELDAVSFALHVAGERDEAGADGARASDESDLDWLGHIESPFGGLFPTILLSPIYAGFFTKRYYGFFLLAPCKVA